MSGSRGDGWEMDDGGVPQGMLGVSGNALQNRIRNTGTKKGKFRVN